LRSKLLLFVPGDGDGLGPLEMTSGRDFQAFRVETVHMLIDDVSADGALSFVVWYVLYIIRGIYNWLVGDRIEPHASHSSLLSFGPLHLLSYRNL
jgi:hypothetical protein